jgi:hypothetical protein
MNVVTSLLGLVIVSHLSPKGSGRFNPLSTTPAPSLCVSATLDSEIYAALNNPRSQQPCS